MTGDQFIFINKKTGETLFSFKGEMDAAYAFVFKMEPNRMFFDERGLENWLNKRAYKALKGKTDSQIISELGLTEAGGRLGRMTDGQCLYALFNHFELPEDDFAIYPAHDTIHACLFSDHRFYRLYPLKTWKGQVNSI